MAARLTILRGLPASGKTTWAKAQRNAWRVSRDDLRAQYTGTWNYRDDGMEALISVLQHSQIRELLKSGNRHVIVDDTNLDWAHIEPLVEIARAMNADWHIRDYTYVPLEVCIERDAAREAPVGAIVITAMHQKYVVGRPRW